MLVAGTLIAAIALFWRLTTGPISITYLTPYFESALSPEAGGFRVEVDDTILDWNEDSRTLNVKLLGAQVIDDRKQTVIVAPELFVSLSAAALLRGQFAPRSLAIYQPAIRITRNERGDFSLGTEGDNFAAHEGAASAIVALLTSREAGRAIGYLARVNILNAQLTINDRSLGFEWSVPDVNISILRSEAGISGATDFELKVGENVAAVQLNVDYRAASDDLSLTVGFAELRPKVLASVADAFAVLEPFDVPLSGTISADLTRDGALTRADFSISGGAGQLSIAEPMALDLALVRSRMRGSYEVVTRRLKVDEVMLDFGTKGTLKLPEPVSHAFPVRTLVAEASWSQAFNRLDIGAFTLSLDGPVIEGSANLQPADGGMRLQAAAQGSGLTFEELAKYWPASLAPKPRRWVLPHIPSGRATEARISISALLSDSRDLRVESINGNLAAVGAVVDYLPPMPKVVNASARARFDKEKFDITLLGGESNGLAVRGGRVVISDLEKKDQWTDVDMTIEGPLRAALAYIDSEPFGFATAVGVSPQDAIGAVSTKLKLRFIAEQRLTRDEVKIQANAAIRDATIPNIAFGMNVSEGDFRLTVDNAGMDVAGKAGLNGLGSDLTWRYNFDEKAPFLSRYRLHARADARDWRTKMGLDWPLIGDDVVSGSVATELTATLRRDGTGTASAAVDLDAAEIAVDFIDWSKSRGERTRASVEATFDKGHITALPKFAVEGAGLTFEGDAVFASDGRIASARIAKLAAGETDLTGIVYPRGGGWEVDIRGPKLDLKRWMEDDTPEDPAKPRGDALAVSLNVDRVRLYEERHLTNVSGALGYDGLVWRDVRLGADLQDGGRLDVGVAPDGAGRKVTIRSDHAGAVLRAFDINDNMVGGRLEIDARYIANAPAACLGGRLDIRDFRMRNAPILAQLLNAASVVGLIENLGGEGIKFDTLNVPFSKTDSTIRFENAKASGLSIGITAAGTVDSVTDRLDIEGSLVPANLINSVLGKIPLVGRLFGGDGGIFAIDYKVQGAKSEPQVTANPLTVLTPGITRNLFDIFGAKEENVPVGCRAAP